MNNTHGKVVTHLGIIRVESVGLADEVFLTRNGLKIFTVVCRPGRPSHLGIEQEFRTYDHREWALVFTAYESWKRQQMPDYFKLPNHSGHTKDGHEHPWRRRPKPRGPHEPEPEPDPDDETE